MTFVDAATEVDAPRDLGARSSASDRLFLTVLVFAGAVVLVVTSLIGLFLACGSRARISR